MIKTHIKVSGLVQGVFFRQSTCEKASALGLTGWVRNLSDGTVEAEIYGTRQLTNELIEWCQQGSSRAKVEAVKVISSSELMSSEILPTTFSIR